MLRYSLLGECEFSVVCDKGTTAAAHEQRQTLLQAWSTVWCLCTDALMLQMVGGLASWMHHEQDCCAHLPRRAVVLFLTWRTVLLEHGGTADVWKVRCLAQGTTQQLGSISITSNAAPDKIRTLLRLHALCCSTSITMLCYVKLVFLNMQHTEFGFLKCSLLSPQAPCKCEPLTHTCTTCAGGGGALESGTDSSAAGDFAQCSEARAVASGDHRCVQACCCFQGLDTSCTVWRVVLVPKTLY